MKKTLFVLILILAFVANTANAQLLRPGRGGLLSPDSWLTLGTYIKLRTSTQTIGATADPVAGVYTSILSLTASSTPATATSTCSAGKLTWDANYLYVCVSTNSWTRATTSSW